MLGNFSQNFPSPGTKLINPDGTLTQEGRLFFLSIFNRTGQSAGILNQVETSITGTGLTQETAYKLTKDWSQIEAGAINTGVIIPALMAGQLVTIANYSGSNKKVYPPTGGIIRGIGVVNVGYDLGSTDIRHFMFFTATDISVSL